MTTRLSTISSYAGFSTSVPRTKAAVCSERCLALTGVAAPHQSEEKNTSCVSLFPALRGDLTVVEIPHLVFKCGEHRFTSAHL